MSLVSVKDLSCETPSKVLFEKATFGIDARDKIAVIGPNGCGKSTLLSMIAASIETQDERFATQNGLRIAYLSQTLSFDPTHTIQEHLFKSEDPAARATRQYQECLNAYENEFNTQTEQALTKATERMDQLDAWTYEDTVSSTLRELDIADVSQKMSALSGGMLKKVALAQFFFNQADLMILDEPTNHLDVATIEWLEERLKRHTSAVIMVTHDRYFLDRICTKIFEIDQKKFFTYTGNYQTYLEQREARYATMQKQEQSFQSVLRRELIWLKRGPKARSTKQKARKDRVHTMLDHKAAASEQEMSLSVSERRLGKKICVLKKVTKAFDERRIINNFSYTFNHGDRIGIVGPNGAGKTTFLNMIMDKLEPDTGDIDRGVNTVFGYFDQHSQEFDLDMTIYEHVSEIGSKIKNHDGSYLSISKFLEQFLFPSSMLKTPIRKLSGGEKRRLHLVCLLLKNPNFLLFDEPTNDLDIQTLSVLENFLATFKGCVLVISHDRYFMDRVVENLFVFKKDGIIDPFQGNYSDYKTLDTETKKSAQKSQKATESAPKTPTKKLSNKEQQEFKQIESEIETLEDKQKILAQKLSTEDSTSSTYEAICKDLQTVSDTLDGHMARWDELAERM